MCLSHGKKVSSSVISTNQMLPLEGTPVQVDGLGTWLGLELEVLGLDLRPDVFCMT